jgi:hypothetical protein
MLNNRSCIVLTYWLADSVFVSVVVGYVLRACVVALECFLLMVIVTKFVAHVAHVAVVAIVIDRKRGMRAIFSLPYIKSRSIIGSKECFSERDDAFFNILLLPNITLITFISCTHFTRPGQKRHFAERQCIL